jgi:hypothetical protein
VCDAAFHLDAVWVIGLWFRSHIGNEQCLLSLIKTARSVTGVVTGSYVGAPCAGKKASCTTLSGPPGRGLLHGEILRDCGLSEEPAPR